ncbi:MAG: alpha/beta fold hydrolase [Blastocatellia bacterium]|nr:alpha/beta fold hydrolase [Blastocatellia bacterium]
MTRFRWLSGVIFLALGFSSTAFAQTEKPGASSARYEVTRAELGRRTQQVERAWLGCSDPTARRKAIPLMQKAVSGFFGGKLAAVAQTLDETTGTLNNEARTSEQVWADSLTFLLTPKLLDPKRPATLQVKQAYQAGFPAAKLLLRLSGQRVLLQAEIGELPLTTTCSVAKLPAGEVPLRIEIVTGQGHIVRSWPTVLSLQPDLSATLHKIKANLEHIQKAETAGNPVQSLEFVSLSAQFNRLEQLAQGQTFETDFPAAAMLQKTLAASTTLKQGKTSPSVLAGPGNLFLEVPASGGTKSVRAWVPTKPADVLVLALHGAGGSENMFFAAYGDGLLVKLCQQRGWAVVAPRVGNPLEDFFTVVEAVRPLVAPKATKIFVVGHSLGAIAALRLVEHNPQAFAGLALISGGAIGELEKLKQVPVLIAAGTEDFSRGGSAKLAEMLKGKGVTTVFKTYEAEHLLVVPEALPDVVNWMDSLSRNRQP